MNYSNQYNNTAYKHSSTVDKFTGTSDKYSDTKNKFNTGPNSQDPAPPPSYGQALGETEQKGTTANSCAEDRQCDNKRYPGESQLRFSDDFEQDEDWSGGDQEPEFIDESDPPRLNSKDKELIEKALGGFCTNGEVSASSSRNRGNLPGIVAIPQVNRGLDKPFSRAYAPDLENCGVSENTFLAFLDGLNMVSVPSPLLQTIMSGVSLVGFVPIISRLVTGVVLQLSTALASVGAIYLRTETFIEKANSRYFAPRGLKVTVMSTRRLAQKLGIHNSHEMIPNLQPEHLKLTVAQRRLVGIRHAVAALNFNVPEQKSPQNGTVDKAAAWCVKYTTKQQEDKLLRARNQCARFAPWYESGMGRAAPIKGKLASFRDNISELHAKRMKSSGQMDAYHQSGVSEQYQSQLDEERQAVLRMRWVVIESVDRNGLPMGSFNEANRTQQLYSEQPQLHRGPQQPWPQSQGQVNGYYD